MKSTPLMMRDQSPSVGARRLRRFTARMILDVCESQSSWTLKRPEVRAPFARHGNGEAKNLKMNPDAKKFSRNRAG